MPASVESLPAGKLKQLEEHNPFFVSASIWWLCLNEFLEVFRYDVPPPKYEFYGKMQSMTYLAQGVRGQVTLVILRFNPDKLYEGVDGEKFTCVSDFWSQPKHKPVGVRLEDAMWEIMFRLVFQHALLGFVQEQARLADGLLARLRLHVHAHKEG